DTPYAGTHIMRRSLPAIALLVLAACGGIQGPIQSVPAASVSPALGLDDAAARQTVRAFVQAYADAPTDHGKSLFPLASGSLMFRWIHWTAVENRMFTSDADAGARARDRARRAHAARDPRRTARFMSANVSLARQLTVRPPP